MTSSSHKGRDPSRVKPRDFSTSDQADLFQRLDEPAQLAPATTDLDINPELLGAINTALRNGRPRGLSRERVIDRMNQFLGGKAVTLRQLNSWTAVSQEYKEFPARYLPAFCAATDCDLPLRVLAQSIARDLVDAREQAALELGASLVETARMRRRQSELRQQLGG